MKKKGLIAAAILAVCAGAAFMLTHQNEAPKYTIGICQFAQHESLDSATKGFKDAVMKKMEGRVAFEEQNAQGDYAVCSTIINGFVSEKVDLILANATASLQTAVTATTEIPTLGTSVTEYGAALQRGSMDGAIEGNISGTSDLVLLEEQADMIKELFPDAGQIGILYCSAEENSQYQADVMQEELNALGYATKHFTFSDSNDIASVTTAAAAECDVIYVPTDNTAASNAEVIANICIPEQIPVAAGAESICRVCGTVTLSINYYELGYTTGEMAVRILDEGADISDMPVAYADHIEKKYNPEICEKMGISVPADYIALDAQ